MPVVAKSPQSSGNADNLRPGCVAGLAQHAMCALPRRPGATELCYIIGGRRGRRCSYAVTAVQPKVLPPLHRDSTLHQLLLSPQALSGSRGRAAAGAKGKPAVRRSMSARPAASAERARLAKRVSMAGILEAGRAGGVMHGFVSTEGILSKIRAKMQAKERGDSTPTRHDFLFSKADRACMAGQLRQAHGRDGVRACRQSLPRLSPAHSDEDAIPWVLEEQDPYGKLPMRRCGHSVRFLFSGNNAADAWADTCAILPSPSSPPAHARSRRGSLPDTRIPETRIHAHMHVSARTYTGMRCGHEARRCLWRMRRQEEAFQRHPYPGLCVQA